MKTQPKLTQTRCQTSICSAEDSPAKVFLSLASEKDLKMLEALSSLRLPVWLERNGLHIFSLKTSQDCYRMTAAGRSLPSSVHWMSWGTMSNGRCLTARILASLNQGAGCTLSDILIPDAPEKYYLSEKQMRKLLSCS